MTRPTLWFVLALAVSCTSSQKPSVDKTSGGTEETDHQVVIVGAGASGLYAAYVLKGLGSYSYPTPGTFPDDFEIGSGQSMRDKLAAPVQSRLFFAGEATHSRQPSTVHGALETGLRAAQEIAGVLGE